LTAVLRREGWTVNRKRVHRLCRREGLKVRRILRKTRAVGGSTNACHLRRAERKDDVWCWDFAFDRTESGTTLKWLSILDEYTRECLALKVARSITSEDVLDTLAELFAMRGVPGAIRSDNGPEFVARAVRDWLGRLQIETRYIAPGSPWENGYAESFHSKLVDEFLSRETFESVTAARRLTAAWKDDYNHHRPHSSLGYVAPAEFAARSAASIPESPSAPPQASPPFQPHCGITQPELS
jgi:transposase InsO family protein